MIYHKRQFLHLCERERERERERDNIKIAYSMYKIGNYLMSYKKLCYMYFIFFIIV